MTRYPDQLAHELRDLVARFLAETVEFEPRALVTVTRAEAPPNGGSATVYLSVLPEERGPRVLQTLRSHRYELQRQVNRALRHRRAPRIRFAIEHGTAA